MMKRYYMFFEKVWFNDPDRSDKNFIIL